MEVEIQRLTEAAERLEREASELRAAVGELAAAQRERAEAERERAEAEQAEAEREPAGRPAPTAAGDAEARLVAYSMVLDGRPRAEVAEHLERELGFTGHGPLLDELYAQGD